MALLVLTSCGGATVINPDKNAVDFTIEGGQEVVIVSADGSWEINECPDWVTYQAQDSVLAIRVERNETGETRRASLLLLGKDDVEAIIQVTQASKCTRINPETDKVEFEKEGGTQTVKIDTDGSPQVEAPEGFTATFAGGVLTINAPANEGGGKNGEIKLTGDDQSATIAVTQKGKVCPRCNGTGKVKCSKCGGRGVVEGVDEYMGSWYKEGCRKCGGRGFYALWGPSDESDVHRGSGKMKCPQCGGSGQ